MYRNPISKKRLAAATLSACILGGAMLPAAASAAVQSGSQSAIAAATAATGQKQPAGQVYNAANPYRIVALGDSITVGYEYGMSDQATPYGYADRVYEQALYHGAAQLSNFGILGLNATGLKNWLAAADSGQSITADDVQQGITKYPNAAATISRSSELKLAVQEADLIVMTIGGNDFLAMLNELGSNNGAYSTEELTGLITQRLDTYISSLAQALQSVASLNPNAKIVLTDQYLPLPKPSAVINVITEEQYAILKAGTAQLSDKVAQAAAALAADGADIQVVPISKAFEGHELAYTAILKKDSHPTQTGYAAIGEAFADAIWGGYRQPAELEADVPLHVIVNGQALNTKNKPVVKRNTTFLPMRDVANLLGAGLKWDNKTQTATIIAGDQKVSFTIGKQEMVVNGKSVPLETPAYLEKNGKTSSTYLPLAALSRGLGYQVIYRGSIKTAFINS